MVECEFRNGSGIERVLAEGIEVLISAEKLRGTDFCVGAIDATTSGQTQCHINPLRHRMYKSPPAPPSGLVSSIGTSIGRNESISGRIVRPEGLSLLDSPVEFHVSPLENQKFMYISSLIQWLD